MGKHLAKLDATPCSSMNNESPFSEMKTKVRNDVMNRYKPKTEPVPVPRKSISDKKKNKKKTSHTFSRRASDAANLKWFTQSQSVLWRKMFTLAYYAAVLKVRESLERGEVKASVSFQHHWFHVLNEAGRISVGLNGLRKAHLNIYTAPVKWLVHVSAVFVFVGLKVLAKWIPSKTVRFPD